MVKILIAGGTGLIGKGIIELLDPQKFQIHILSRSKKSDRSNVRFFQWNLQKGEIEQEALDVDHIINLTGAGIADKRWSAARKELLISTRVDSARIIQEGLRKSGFRPKSYISASAIGYYGDSGDKLMTEENKPVDNGFLSQCCVRWEESAALLSNQVDRLAILRIGIVLSKEGGAFQKMLLPFKAGMASYFASGNMQYSWIHIEDMVRLILHTINEKEIKGIYNATAPNPVTNKELIQSIRNNKKSFSILNSVPSFALKMIMGEMSAVVLTSNLSSSKKIEATGFQFNYPSIDQAIINLLATT